jgi:hypothetical protein
MIEFVPFAISVAFGALISRYTVRRMGQMFLVAVALVGICVTFLSGENWTFLPKDILEASAGLAFGMVVTHALFHVHQSLP